MKKLLTLALTLVALAAFTGPAVGQGAQQKNKQTSPSTSSETKAAAPREAGSGMATGRVTKVNSGAQTFTVTANGEEFTFDAKNLTYPPPIGELVAMTISPASITIKCHPAEIPPTTIDVQFPCGGTYTRGKSGVTMHAATPVGTANGNAMNGSQGMQAASDRGVTHDNDRRLVHGINNPGDSAPASASPVPTPGPVGATTIHGSKSNTSFREGATSPNKVMTGKVLSVNKVANTFTVMSKGNKVTFIMKKGDALPEVGKIVDITYNPTTPGGPFNAITVNNSKSINL